MEMQLDNSQTEIKPKPQTKLSSFHKKFIIILSASTIVLIFTWVFVNKEASRIISSSDNIIKFRENQSSVNMLMEHIAKLERESKEIGSDFERYQNLLVDKRDLADVRKKINDIFLKKKLDPMFSFVTENSPKDKEPGSYGFNLVVTGQLSKVLESIQEIKSLKILITFDQVVIAKVLPKSVSLPELDNISRDTATTTVPRIVIPKTDLYKATIQGKIYLKEAIIEN